MNNLQPACFGKCPLHADFIRHNVVGDEIKALDQWFQEGIHLTQRRLGRAWVQDFRNMPTWRFVFQTPDSPAFLIGIVLPSQDKSGRSYPFFLYFRVDKNAFAKSTTLAPQAFSGELEILQQFISKNQEGLKLSAFLDLLQNLDLPIPIVSSEVQTRIEQRLKDETSHAFWTTLFGDFEDDRKYQLHHNLCNLLAPPQNQSLATLPFALQFPLVPQDTLQNSLAPTDIAYYFALLSQSTNLEATPVFFWQRDATKATPSLLSFFSPPSKKQWPLLLDPEKSNDFGYNLCAPEESKTTLFRNRINRHHKLSLGRPELSMATLLTTLQRSPSE